MAPVTSSDALVPSASEWSSHDSQHGGCLEGILVIALAWLGLVLGSKEVQKLSVFDQSIPAYPSPRIPDSSDGVDACKLENKFLNTGFTGLC